jgi:hypothetical protein
MNHISLLRSTQAGGMGAFFVAVGAVAGQHQGMNFGHYLSAVVRDLFHQY